MRLLDQLFYRSYIKNFAGIFVFLSIGGFFGRKLQMSGKNINVTFYSHKFDTIVVV